MRQKAEEQEKQTSGGAVFLLGMALAFVEGIWPAL